MASTYKTGTDFTSATLADLGDGIDLGAMRFEGNSIFTLCKAGGAINDGAFVTISSSAEFSVTESAAGDESWGVCNVSNGVNSSDQVPSANYFWCLIWGPGYDLSGGAYSDGDRLEVSGAGGVVDTLTTNPVVAWAREAATAASQKKNIFVMGRIFNHNVSAWV